MKPAASPCARRATTSRVMSGAAPQAALHSTKPHRAMRKIFRRSSASPSQARRDEGEGERQRVPGHHPLHVGGGGAQVPLHGGQRDRDDRDVQQAHETGDQRHPERPPTARVRFVRVPGAPGCRSPDPDADAVTRSPLARPDTGRGPTWGHGPNRGIRPEQGPWPGPGAPPEQGEHVPRPGPAHTRHAAKGGRPARTAPSGGRGQTVLLLPRTTSRCGTVRSVAGRSLRGL